MRWIRVSRRVRMGEKKCKNGGQKEEALRYECRGATETGSERKRLKGELWTVCVHQRITVCIQVHV